MAEIEDKDNGNVPSRPESVPKTPSSSHHHSHHINNNLPSEKAAVYFDRARTLSLVTSGSSIELERQLKEVYRALSFGSDEVAYYMFLGKFYRQSQDLSAALFCYRYSLKLDPLNVVAKQSLFELLVIKGKELMIMGEKYFWVSKFTAARACFEEAIEFDKENIELWVLKTVCHVQTGELNAALESINKAMKFQGADNIPVEVYILRAKIHWGKGLLEAGNTDIRVASAMAPNHPGMHLKNTKHLYIGLKQNYD